MIKFRYLYFSLAVSFAASGQDVLFKSEARLVEVYATVQDQHGRYIEGLTQDRFSVVDEGQPQQLLAFEPESSALSCALLLDTTGSMQKALPSVKNAVLSFLDELRPSDTVAAYSFSAALNLLQDFTLDHESLKRAILRTRAGGNTALFDAVAQVAHEISGRQGKKVIVVFTDGGDNASVLRAESAVTRARKTGIPVYVVAEGDALTSPQLMKLLRSIADGSGANVYEAKHLSDVGAIFHDILASVQHTYMLAYKPPAAPNSNWRAIRLSVDGLKNYHVHAKEGYFPQ
jgi:Ca-activated chloride channel family protein